MYHTPNLTLFNVHNMDHDIRHFDMIILLSLPGSNNAEILLLANTVKHVELRSPYLQLLQIIFQVLGSHGLVINVPYPIR